MVDKGLYGYQIGHAMDGFVDLYAADEVSNLTPPVIAVCNTGVSGTEGEHWVVVCIDRYGYGEFFYSFGMHPIVYGFSENITNKSKSWIYNDIRLQGPASAACGYYVIGYSMFKINGYGMDNFVSMFSNVAEDNDELIINWIIDNRILS